MSMTRNLLISQINEQEQLYAYGVEWDKNDSNPDVTRVGNMSLHASLPIQSAMKGCLLNDNGDVVKYLNASSWTSETRDGSQGQVMVEIPHFYWKFSEDVNGIQRVMLSLKPLYGYKEAWPGKMYVSAYQAALDRTNLKLASVVNTTAQYRGGNNTSSWDEDSQKTLLGRPITNVNLTNFRTYARNRKPNSTEWNCNTYLIQKVLYWLFVVEFATRNTQEAIDSTLTTEGYHKGGLGSGVTNVSDTIWNSYNSRNPFVACGYTDSLGNGTGQVSLTMPLGTNGANVTIQVPRYRGIENPFGHIWEWTDGIHVKVQSETDGGESQVYVSYDPAIWNDNNYTGYTYIGNELRSSNWVKEILFGANGDIMCKTNGTRNTYYCDYHYTNIPTTTVLRGIRFGGTSSYGSAAGLVCSGSVNGPTFADAIIGSRLCFLPASEQTEAYGVQWDKTATSPDVQRVGNTDLHVSLPIQSKMRGCLLDDNGNVTKYLTQSDWESSTLGDESHQVMIEIPDFYWKFSESGNILKVMLSEQPLTGYTKVNKFYVSAYEATVDRGSDAEGTSTHKSEWKLASVKSNAARFRGGNNDATKDNAYNTQLQMPATQISLTDFRTYARRRKANSTEWNCNTYLALKVIYWLYVVEYATMNSLKAVDSTTTDEGYKKGGLGNGVTAANGTNWNNMFSYYPIIPIGSSDTLGNGTGEANYNSTGSDGETVWYTAKVARYRGIENPFGHIWKWTDGVCVQVESGDDGESKVYVTDDPSKFNSSNNTGYTYIGNEARTNDTWIKEVLFGNNGDILCKAEGGSSSQYFTDKHYTSIPTSGSVLRAILFGGYSNYGSSAGLVCSRSHSGPSGAAAGIGSRLVYDPSTI